MADTPTDSTVPSIDNAYLYELWKSIQNRKEGVFPWVTKDTEEIDKIIRHLKYYQDVYEDHWKYISFTNDYSGIIIMKPINPQIKKEVCKKTK